MAQSFDRDGWLATLARDPSPPLFPMLINGTHTLLTGLGLVAQKDWGPSAQLAAAFSLLLATPACVRFVS